MSPLALLPSLDSDDRAERCPEVLAISRERAAGLGRTAVVAIETGSYPSAAGHAIDWRDAVARACGAKISLPPDAPLPESRSARFPKPGSRFPTKRLWWRPGD